MPWAAAILSAAVFIFLMGTSRPAEAQLKVMSSPDGTLKAKWEDSAPPTLHILNSNDEKLASWELGFEVKEADGPIIRKGDGEVQNGKVRTSHPSRINIKASIPDRYNWWRIPFSEGFAVEVRVYNEAVAYRWTVSRDDSLHVLDERADLDLNREDSLLHAVTDTYIQNYEVKYRFARADSINGLMTLPAMVRSTHGQKLLISESGLYEYPALYLGSVAGSYQFYSELPNRVLEDTISGARRFNRNPSKRAGDLAKVSGERAFPWRLIVAVEQEKELMEQAFVWKLAEPSRIENMDWIEPGMVSWDWWNAWSIYDVPFQSGVNTRTYKYMIDVAARYDIPYVNLDEGWSDTQDLLDVKEDVDVAELADYAEQKDVGLFLWCVWHTLDRQMEEALDQFEEWGIAGIKVDFMDRDDQQMVQFYSRLAGEAAEREILINYHGSYKPAGLHRTWPNVINREGVLGNEYNKWSDEVTPRHQVTLPFTRMAVGPMDFTPGGMRNTGAKEFIVSNDRPRVQGTRAHQMAMFVVYYGPLQMLADSPTDYLKEPEVFDFLTDIPTTWDETVAVEGKAQSHVVLARRKGDTWYLGAMTNSSPRTIEVPLNFLEEGATYAMETWEDGVNARQVPKDVAQVERQVQAGETITLELKPAGGWVGRFEKE